MPTSSVEEAAGNKKNDSSDDNFYEPDEEELEEERECIPQMTLLILPYNAKESRFIYSCCVAYHV